MLGVEMKGKTETSADSERILIVLDGERWWIRHIYLIEHQLDFNRKLYHSDRTLAGPFDSIEEAVAAAKEMLPAAQSLSGPPSASFEIA